MHNGHLRQSRRSARALGLRRGGFTLIELLVVISIIGLLSSIVLTSINMVRIKARNVARNADIEQLRTAFELGRDSSGRSYLLTTIRWVCISTSCYGGWGSVAADQRVDAYLAPHIKKPTDPPDSGRGYGGYLYGAWGSSGTGFPYGEYLNWLLESVPLTDDVCGPGQYYAMGPTYIQCLLKFD